MKRSTEGHMALDKPSMARAAYPADAQGALQHARAMRCQAQGEVSHSCMCRCRPICCSVQLLKLGSVAGSQAHLELQKHLLTHGGDMVGSAPEQQMRTSLIASFQVRFI